MKRFLAPMLVALLAASPALAQGDADPAPGPPDRGPGQRDAGPRDGGPRGDGPRSERGERPERPERPERGEPGERGERGPRGDFERGERPWQLSPDELGDAIELIERINPRLAESLRETQEESPERAVRRIAEEAPRTYELLRMRAEEPDRFALHMQSMRVMQATWPLVRQLRQAQRDEDQPKIDELTEQMRASMETLYDIRLKLRELEIQELRDQLEALEARHAQDRDRRSEHIASRLDDILNGNMGRRRGDRGEGPDDRRGEAPNERRGSREGRAPRD